MSEKLIDVVRAHEGRMAIPLVGFSDIQLNRSTLKQNAFNWAPQFSALFAPQQRFRPDGLFFFMDLSVEGEGACYDNALCKSPSPGLEPGLLARRAFRARDETQRAVFELHRGPVQLPPAALDVGIRATGGLRDKVSNRGKRHPPEGGTCRCGRWGTAGPWNAGVTDDDHG